MNKRKKDITLKWRSCWYKINNEIFFRLFQRLGVFIVSNVMITRYTIYNVYIKSHEIQVLAYYITKSKMKILLPYYIWFSAYQDRIIEGIKVLGQQNLHWHRAQCHHAYLTPWRRRVTYKVWIFESKDATKLVRCGPQSSINLACIMKWLHKSCVTSIKVPWFHFLDRYKSAKHR